MSSGKISTPIIIASGSGYDGTVTVTFSAPVVPLHDPGHIPLVTATGYATVSSGLIVSITLTNSGSGYTSDPVITISVPPSGVVGQAHAISYVMLGLQQNPNNGVYSGGSTNIVSHIKSDGTCVVTGNSINVGALGSIAINSANPSPCKFLNRTTRPTCVRVFDTFHTKFVIGRSGLLYGCGINNAYQLGNGTTTPLYGLTIITLNYPVLKFATGFNYTQSNVGCLALTTVAGLKVTNGTSLYVWGLNANGELGSGNTNSITTPTLRTPILPSNTYIHDVFSTSTAGFGSSTFLLLKYTESSGWGFSDRGAGVLACGANGVGQLGIGNTTNPTTLYTNVVSELVVCIGFFNMVNSPVEYLNGGQTYVTGNWRAITIIIAGNYKIRIPNIDTYGCTGNATIQITKTAVGTGIVTLLATLNTTPGNNYTISTGTLATVSLVAGDLITLAGASSSVNSARWYISYQTFANINNVSSIAVCGNDNLSTTYFLQNYIGNNGTRVNIVYAVGWNDANSYYGTEFSALSSFAVVSTMLIDNIVEIRSTSCNGGLAGGGGSSTMFTALTESGSLYWFGFNSVALTTITNNTNVGTVITAPLKATILWSPRGFPYGPNPAIPAGEQAGSVIYKYVARSGNNNNKSITILLKNGIVNCIGGGWSASSSLLGNGTNTVTSFWSEVLLHRKDFIDLCCSGEINNPVIPMLTSTGDIYSVGNNDYGQFGASVMGVNNYMPGKMIF
jgi:hypothetical protein